LDASQRQPLLDEAKTGEGITGASLKTALEKSGYAVSVFTGTLDHEVTGLYYHLDRGRPLIVMFATDDGSRAHYLLVTGYDPETNMVAVLDSLSGKHAVRLKDFRSRWNNAHQFTLLAVPANAESAGPALTNRRDATPSRGVRSLSAAAICAYEADVKNRWAPKHRR
jgi:hypothetical protein